MHLEPMMQRLDALRHDLLQHRHEEYARELQFVRERISQVGRSIDDLLHASALERGLVPLNLETVDLVRLVREVVEQYRGELAPVYVRAPEGLPAQLDPARIRSAIDALVRNALRRSPGSVPVGIDIEVLRQNGDDRAIVSVQDEGTSIAADPLPSLAAGFPGHPDSTSLGLRL